MTAPYLDYFGLAEAPFSIAPAPRFLYMSRRHQEALAHLLYGVEGEGGFVLLTGEVGAGKTTLCRDLLDRLPENRDVAYVFNPKLTVEELLATVCAEFGIPVPDGNTSNKIFVDRLNAHLLDLHARGRHAVLIIDEAQNLSAEVLEQMRLLTNLETSERKLLQIVLLGQPELAALLARPELRQLAQRIVARYHLGPLDVAEVAAYVRHRLAVAGTERPLFPSGLARRLHRLSGGVPRVINLICDRALLGAYVLGRERVDRATLDQAAREVFGQAAPSWRTALRPTIAAGLVLLAGGALALALYRPAPAPEAPAEPASVAVAAPDRLDWPTGADRADSEALAHAALFRAWGLDYRGGDACREAESQGLRCLGGRGGLDDLRRFDRPALLRLNDRQGREFHAVLLELTPDSATFALGGETRTVAPVALASQWSGRYTLLWRPPAEVRDTLRPGDRGEAVTWLRARFAALDGRAAASADPGYDAALVARVKRFQLEQGLAPDGCVGEQTLVRLVDRTAGPAPALTGRK